MSDARTALASRSPGETATPAAGPVTSEGPRLVKPDADTLFARIRDGDERAFETAFRAHYDALARFAWRYAKDRSTAEDIVQDVFTTLWTTRRAIRITASLRAYLYAAVRNRALNRIDHNEVVEAWEREQGATDAPRLYARPLRPDELLELSLREEELAAAFDALPERQALAMTLKWRDGLSYAEIAEALGISERGVEKHLARGLQALRQHLL